MELKNSFYIILIAFTIASCAGSKSKDPNSSGRGSEIIVVCSEVQWNGPIGDTIRSVFSSPMEGLPEAEPEFTLINIPENDFNKFLQAYSNVLVINIAPENKKSKVETLKNVWSHPQRVIKIKTASDTAFFNLFAKHCIAIKELYNQNERERFNAQNALSRNFEIEKTLADTFGIKMMVSKDFYPSLKGNDYILLRSENAFMHQGLMIYTYPYNDTSLINPEAVLKARKKYTKLYIPRHPEGANMITESEKYKPVNRKILFKGMYALETRGLWRIEGDSTSGPFVNYTIVDAPRQRIVVFDGYVYCPNKSKRNFVRQFEAIIWGAEFIDPYKPVR